MIASRMLVHLTSAILDWTTPHPDTRRRNTRKSPSAFWAAWRVRLPTVLYSLSGITRAKKHQYKYAKSFEIFLVTICIEMYDDEFVNMSWQVIFTYSELSFISKLVSDRIVLVFCNVLVLSIGSSS